MNTLEHIFSTILPFITPDTAEYWQGAGIILAWVGFAILLIAQLLRKFSKKS